MQTPWPQGPWIYTHETLYGNDDRSTQKRAGNALVVVRPIPSGRWYILLFPLQTLINDF